MKAGLLQRELGELEVSETATVMGVDFSKVDEQRTPPPRRAVTAFGTGRKKSMTPKQLRARQRRRVAKGGTPDPIEFSALYKPIEEWDAEELARGRPRNRGGDFSGPAPQWLTRAMHEEAMSRFKQLVRDKMNTLTKDAVDILENIISNEEVDDKGRPMVAASTKLDAIKFLLDHVVGKPTQRVEADISVRLQGVLAAAVITPATLPAHSGARELASPRTEADWEIEEAEEVE